MNAKHVIVDVDEKDEQMTYKWNLEISDDGKRLHLYCNNRVILTADVADGCCDVWPRAMEKSGWEFRNYDDK